MMKDPFFMGKGTNAADSDVAVIDVASSSVSLPPFLSLSLKDADGLSFI